jgi:hypothetical protein
VDALEGRKLAGALECFVMRDHRQRQIKASGDETGAIPDRHANMSSPSAHGREQNQQRQNRDDHSDSREGNWRAHNPRQGSRGKRE